MKGKRLINKYKRNIKLFLTDCDGCLTDGGMYYTENGDEIKKFNTKDGVGIQILRQHKILVGIITGEKLKLNYRRAQKLHLDECLMGVKDKYLEIQNLCDKYNISMKQVLYIGDDINDLEAIKHVGVSCCPNDAVRQIKREVNYVTKAKGGEGVIREIVDMLF